MTGGNVFYAMLNYEKDFHVYSRNNAITKAMRTRIAEAFESFLKNPKLTVVQICAEQVIIMPGNLVHSAYTIMESEAIRCIFLSESQMKNSLITRQ